MLLRISVPAVEASAARWLLRVFAVLAGQARVEARVPVRGERSVRHCRFQPALRIRVIDL